MYFFGDFVMVPNFLCARRRFETRDNSSCAYSLCISRLKREFEAAKSINASNGRISAQNSATRRSQRTIVDRPGTHAEDTIPVGFVVDGLGLVQSRLASLVSYTSFNAPS